MKILEAHEITKCFEDKKAVDTVSLSVNKGDFFGLLGPNGAGKTTLVRILMSLRNYDSGKIWLFGKEKFGEELLEKIGYLPEEKGLYEENTGIENICYIASLKGIKKEQAETEGRKLLEKIKMEEYADKKVKKMSKGTRQKIQLVATLVHDPQLLVLDEPFSGLDPYSVKLIKRLLLELHSKGKTIVLSTHLINTVEEMCTRILMVNNGRRMLYGDIDDVKERYAQNSIVVETSSEIKDLEGADHIERYGSNVEIAINVTKTPEDILEELLKRKIKISKYEVKELSLNSIFIKLVEAEQWIK